MGLSRVFSNTTVQKHQFFGTQPSSQSNSHIHTSSLLSLLSVNTLPVHHQLPEFTQTHVPSSIRVFSSESTLHLRWPKYWSFSLNISPFSEYSVLISFRMDWLGLLAVQGTLKCLLQHHSSNASVLWHSAFFYGPTVTSIHDHWKNHRLD